MAGSAVMSERGEPSVKLHWIHVLSGIAGAFALYLGQGLISSFRLGGYVQETFVTKTDLVTERAYEKEQHDSLAQQLKEFSNNNHTDMILRLESAKQESTKTSADQSAKIEVMNTKLDGLHDLLMSGAKKGK